MKNLQKIQNDLSLKKIKKDDLKKLKGGSADWVTNPDDLDI